MNVNSEKIKLCALMPYPFDTAPSQRFRIEQWEPYLDKEQILIDYYSFADEKLNRTLYKKGHTAAKLAYMLSALLRRFGHVARAGKYDAVFIHRGASLVGPAFLERLINITGVPIIFDFDDSIFLADTSNANKFFSWAKFVGKVKEICRISSAVTVGNSYLKKYADAFNENVFIVPTSIDTERYKPVEQTGKRRSEKIIIGWTGSSTSQYHLEAFEPTLAELLERRSDVEIRVISDRKPDFENIECTWREWSAETEVEETRNFDIGIMPIPDNQWTRGKCAAKALICMSLGIPTICSNVGANRDVIKNGENGFLADTSEQWLEYFDVLIDNETLRRDMSIAARATVVNNYSMKKCAELFADVVRKTVGK